LLSYLKTKIVSKKTEHSLEDFFINRFGKKLYLTFFKDYTEKVWGKSCNEISAEWGAQRIKELSISKAIAHAIKSKFKAKGKGDISQKNTETSLIERFLYPKYGPGQMWETVAALIIEMGGEIHLNHTVEQFEINQHQITSCSFLHNNTKQTIQADYVFSTMPVKYLIKGMGAAAPNTIQQIANGLEYRDFVTVGVLLNKLSLPEKTLEDNWIYVQEKDVKVGRIQVFNNWSPHLVKDENTIWLGLEYFCYKNDELWNKSDEEFINFAIVELEQMGFAKKADLLDATVVRMEKTYPAYFGTYNQFNEIINFTNQFENLYLIGRNGMHKYNNSDHSMLTAITAVENIIINQKDKSNIWAINTEMEYHEETNTSTT
jgi:protoporphyrinogen oxidase